MRLLSVNIWVLFLVFAPVQIPVFDMLGLSLFSPVEVPVETPLKMIAFDTDGDGVDDVDDVDDDNDGLTDAAEGMTYATAGSSFNDGDAVSSGSNIFTSGSINPTLTLTDNTGNTWFIDMTWETSEFGDPDGGPLADGLLVDAWSNNVSTHPVQISLELDFNTPVSDLELTVGDIDGSNGSNEEYIEVYAYDEDNNLISLSSDNFPFLGSNLERTGNKVSPNTDAWPGNNLTTNSFQLFFTDQVSRIVLDGYDGQDNLYFNINGVAYGTVADQDGNGIPDHKDIDSDDDGITDNVEAQSTSAYVAPSGTDTDGDGLDDAYDPDCTPCGGVTGVSLSAVDTDGDATVDYLDTDSDNDGISDAIEGHDTNGDGVVDGSDTPNANTGLAGGTTDADNDGLLDGFDNSTGAWDATNGSLTAESHPDVQAGGTAEQDWREGPDSDLDGVVDSDDLDDDNDGIPDVAECFAMDEAMDGFITPDAFDITGSGGSAPVTLNSITIGGQVYSDFVTPDSYSYDFSTTNPSGTGNIRAVENSAYGADFGTSSDWAADILPAFQSLNMNYYQIIDIGLSSGVEYYQLSYNTPITVTPKLFLVTSERTGNNEVILEALDANQNPLGSQVSVEVSDYVDTGANIDPGSENLEFAILPFDDLADLGDQVYHIRVYDNESSSTDAADGKVFIFGDAAYSCADTDGDGIINSLDLDSDDDGIADIIEANGTDSDGDGQVDYGTAGNPSTMTDADGDGLFDDVDDEDSGSGGGEVTNGTALTDPDSDGDGVLDRVDIDSDNDGIADNVEAQTTAGYTAPAGSDTDGDGIDNAYDGDDNTTTGIGGGPGTALSPTDTDSDLTEDYLDTDSDNDGVYDVVEGHDTNGDGVINGSDSPNANTGLSGGSTDTDEDGLLDGFDNNTSSWDATNGSLTAESHPDVHGGTTEQDWREVLDTDGDGIIDFNDLDDDNDGIPDVDENYTPSGVDTDGDGIDDVYDSDCVGSIPYSAANAASISKEVSIAGSGAAAAIGSDNSRAAINHPTNDTLILDLGLLVTSGTIIEIESRVTTSFHEMGVEESSDGNTFSNTQTYSFAALSTDQVQTYTLSSDARYIFIYMSTDAGGGAIQVDNVGYQSFSVPSCGGVTGVALPDADGDEIPDHRDLDSDADGIPDLVEAGGADSDGDGKVDVSTDTDGDGLVDTYDNDDTDGPDVSGCTFGVDCDLSASTTLLLDTNADGTNDNDRDEDSDGYANYVDIDSDGDGIVDINEAQGTSAYVAPSGTDTDGDGIADAYDVDCSPCGGVTGLQISPVNTDGEADNPDYLDTDSDEDGESDTSEAYDSDDDGSPNTTPAGTDTDGDGLDDNFDGNDLSAAASTNPDDNGETPAAFPNTDIPGGEPNWREATAGGAAAPIELLSFTVYTLQNGQVKILWKTLTETNNDFFTLERSREAENWEEFAYVKGAGDSQEILSYQEIDRAPFLGTSYYRLKQTDFNGDFSYSNIMEIYIDPGLSMPLTIYPNPTQGSLTIEGAPDELTSFTFYDVVGKDVTAQVSIIYRDDFQIQLDISNLPRGVYLLKTENETVKVERE